MEFLLPDDNIGGDDSASNATRASGSKRSFGDLEDDEDAIFGSSDGTKVDVSAPGVPTAMILSLRESLENCQDDLASCQNELESAKTEIQKWKSAFEKESFVPARKSPEPSFVIDYIQSLRSSESSLNEQLEIAQMKLAIRDLKSHLEPESMKRGTTDGDPEVDSEQQGSTAAGPSRNVAKLEEVEVDKGRGLGYDILADHGGNSYSTRALLDDLRAANALIAHMEEVQAVRLAALEKTVAELAKEIEYSNNLGMLVQQKIPSVVPPSAPEDDDE